VAPSSTGRHGGQVPRDAEVRRQRARLAALRRHHPDDPSKGDDERRALRAVQIDQHVKRLVDSFPELTQQQRARLATLLAGGGDGDAGAS
jgi:hypothetical protein